MCAGPRQHRSGHDRPSARDGRGAGMEVARWTGREAAALRLARRMSVRAYAARLGVTAATVSNWHSRAEHARLRTATQQLLDIDLAQAPVDVRERFRAILAGEGAEVRWPRSGREAH